MYKVLFYSQYNPTNNIAMKLHFSNIFKENVYYLCLLLVVAMHVCLYERKFMVNIAYSLLSVSMCFCCSITLPLLLATVGLHYLCLVMKMSVSVTVAVFLVSCCLCFVYFVTIVNKSLLPKDLKICQMANTGTFTETLINVCCP